MGDCGGRIQSVEVTRKKKRYISESVYDEGVPSVLQILLTSAWDGITLTLNTLLIAIILVIMGLLQGFLSLSEENWVSKSSLLRIRKGKEKIYKIIPTRTVSRLWGFIHRTRLAYYARPFMFKFYSFIYKVNIEEAKCRNLYAFPNLGEFFRREIHADARPLAKERLVSPCDGKIMVLGDTQDGFIEQIKGSSFTVDQFLGPHVSLNKEESVFSYRSDDKDNRIRYCHQLMTNPEANKLYYSVIYLAPGDYHRFHSPTEFKVNTRRHFPGHLFSVNPSITSWFDDLFVLNERVTLFGEWMHGFFSYTAVGATMVGSIKLPWDRELRTNTLQSDNWKSGDYFDKRVDKSFQKGEEIGEFNLGSTIVLVFEAPNGYQFPVKANDVVKLGQAFVTHPRKRHSMPNILSHIFSEVSAVGRSSKRNHKSFHGARRRTFTEKTF